MLPVGSAAVAGAAGGAWPSSAANSPTPVRPKRSTASNSVPIVVRKLRSSSRRRQYSRVSSASPPSAVPSTSIRQRSIVAMMGSTSRRRRSRMIVSNMCHTSVSAAKYSFRSPNRCTRWIRPQSTSARRFMLALPRETWSCAMMSSVQSGRVDTKSRAWISAMVRLMPQ